MLLRNIARSIGKQLTVKALSIYDQFHHLEKYESFVLVYHRVVGNRHKTNISTPNDIYNISQKDFEKHITFLKKSYEIVSLDSLVDDLKNFKPISGKIALTFDDGFRDNYEYAYPIIKEYNFPATIYLMGYPSAPVTLWWLAIEALILEADSKNISFRFNDIYINYPIQLTRDKIKTIKILSSYFMSIPFNSHNDFLKMIFSSLGKDSLPDHQSLMLSKEMIKDMYNSGLVSFGGHSKSHSVLSLLDKKMLDSEIAEHRSRLKDILDVPISSFSYPYGMPNYISEEAVDTVKKSGYKYAVSGLIGQLSSVNDDYFMLPRVTATGCSSVNDLNIRTSNLYKNIKLRFGI